MTDTNFSLTRRSALFAAVASLLQTSTLIAGEKQVITVHKDIYIERDLKLKLSRI